MGPGMWPLSWIDDVAPSYILLMLLMKRSPIPYHLRIWNGYLWEILSNTFSKYTNSTHNGIFLLSAYAMVSCAVATASKIVFPGTPQNCFLGDGLPTQDTIVVLLCGLVSVIRQFYQHHCCPWGLSVFSRCETSQFSLLSGLVPGGLCRWSQTVAIRRKCIRTSGSPSFGSPVGARFAPVGRAAGFSFLQYRSHHTVESVKSPFCRFNWSHWVRNLSLHLFYVRMALPSFHKLRPARRMGKSTDIRRHTAKLSVKASATASTLNFLASSCCEAYMRSIRVAPDTEQCVKTLRVGSPCHVSFSAKPCTNSASARL